MREGVRRVQRPIHNGEEVFTVWCEACQEFVDEPGAQCTHSDSERQAMSEALEQDEESLRAY